MQTENIKVEQRGQGFVAIGYTHNWASDTFVLKGKTEKEALEKLLKAVEGDKDGEWLKPEINQLLTTLLSK